MMQMLVARRRASAYSGFSVWQQCGGRSAGLISAGLLVGGVEGMLIGNIVALLFAFPLLTRCAFSGILGDRFSRSIAIETASYGFPLMATNLAGWALRLSDRYLLGAFRGEHELGLYAVSYSIADGSIYLIVSLLVLASAPIVMELWEKQGPEKTGRFITEITHYYLIVAIPAAVGLSLVGKLAVSTLATEDFHEGHKIIPLIAVSMLLMGLQRNFQIVLLFHKKTTMIMRLLFLTSGLNIALNLLLIPKFGFLGAGCSATISYSCLTFLMVRASRRLLVWNFPWRTALKSFAAAGLMSLVVLGFLDMSSLPSPITLLVSVGLGACAYAGVLFLLGEFRRPKIGM
jgi:O-antigen/teichoic acid export membrane protein